MSTAIGYICQTHEPNIESELWYQRSYFERLLKLIASRDEVLKALDLVEIDTVPPEVEWMRNHRNCKVGIIDEYGRLYGINGDPITKTRDGN